MSAWQPIESAPKDGTRVLIYQGGHVYIAWWDEKDWTGVWVIFDCDDSFYSLTADHPTHWLPLPDPPETP